MSSFDRRAAVLMLAAFAAGCGFQPVYAPGGSAEGLRGTIGFDTPSDLEGFALVRQLEDRLGLADVPSYLLSARIFTDQQELGVTPDQIITRYNLRGRVEFSLLDQTTGRVATSGQVASFTSYSATGTPFATQTAREDATNRLMAILADQIVSRLLVTAGEWRQ